MYEEFYGLKQNPFNITPDPKFLYLSESHEEGLAHLLYGIERQRGLIVLTGEAGTGKTILLNTLVEKLQNRAHVAFLVNSMVDITDIFQYAFREYGLELEGKTKGELLINLKNFLFHCSEKQEKVILIIDEAQNLSDDVLEEIRLLTNFETSSEKLIQIILAGQPGLHDKINMQSHYNLKQRVGIIYNIAPLNLGETKCYIENRLNIVDAKYKIFTDDAIEQVYGHSKGIPRLINIICDSALFFGFSDQKKEIGQTTITQVIESLDVCHPAKGEDGGFGVGVEKAGAMPARRSYAENPPAFRGFEGEVPRPWRPEPRVKKRRGRRAVRVAVAAGIMGGLVAGGALALKSERVTTALTALSQPVWRFFTEGGSASQEAVPPFAGAAGDPLPSLREQRQERKIITVRSGETLAAILRREYGRIDPHVLSLVREANPNLTETLEAGQRLVLPALPK
jgi:general secretion pathway protein A